MAGFVINFPRRSRPRGLGYAGGVGDVLTGLGTWVVDTEYGLGPRFREGYNRPYPPEAIPTRWPRAQAARVLGPSSAANVVARPFAATRLPTIRYPVRMAPVTAPGAQLRNPGVAGYGLLPGVPDSVTAVGMALKETSVWGSTLGAVAVGMGGKVAGLKGTPRKISSWGSLGLFGFAALNFYKQYSDILKELKTAGAAEVGVQTVRGVMDNVNSVLKGTATDADKKGVLIHFSCYENARRTDTWWGRIRGTARNPLKDCGLTAAQAAMLKNAFAKIPRAERQSLGGAIYKPGGSLEDLG